MRNKLFVMSQYLAPQLTLSRLAGRLADLEHLPPALRHRFIQWFINRYGVEMSEAEDPDFRNYPSFNSFFTRPLKTGARPIEEDSRALVSPVDGTISQLGKIDGGQIFQAKGHHFDLDTLLGGIRDLGKPFRNGQFMTIYLAPRDYHRIHMPLAGRLTDMVYVPGKLFSVNPVTAANVPSLFARNERVVTLFETEQGPIGMVHVGAMIVGSVETVWAGIVAPGGTGGNGARTVQHRQYTADQDDVKLSKGAEMGRFRLGSTVILLLPEGMASWNDNLESGSTLRMGEAMAQLK